MNRLWLVLAGCFWVGMNVLLWRSEYGGGSTGTPLPVSNVISKVLETPDPSELEIYYQNERVGNCRWMVSQLSGSEEEPEPEDEVDLEAAEMSGLIKNIKSFAINLDGHLQWQREARRVRYMLNVILTPDWKWKTLDAKVCFRDQWFHVHSRQAEGTVAFEFEQGPAKWESEITFEQLKHPETLLEQWLPENPLLVGLAAPLQAQVKAFAGDGSDSVAGLPSLENNWKAYSDWLTIAHSRMRVYRMEHALEDKPNISVTINRAGEILTVTLPQRILIKNEGVLGM